MQLGIPRSICVFERRERLLPLAQSSQEERQFGCGAALLARSQPLKDRQRACAVARLRGRGAKIDLCGRRVEPERNGSLVRRNSLRGLALSGIRVSEKQMRLGIVSIQLDGLVQGIDRLIVSTGGRQHVPDGRVDSG